MKIKAKNSFLLLGLIGLTVQAQEDVPTKDWRHITQATRSVAVDTDFLAAVNGIITAVQKAAVVGAYKVSSQLSDQEKQTLHGLIDILKRLFEKYGAALQAGGVELLDEQAQYEINQLGQELMVCIMPLMMLAQDPSFNQSNEELVYEMRVKMFDGLKQAIEDVSKEIE